MSQAIHIALGEAEFLTLVAGDVFTTIRGGQEVKIILSDIGFDRMLAAAIDTAIMRQRGSPRADPR